MKLPSDLGDIHQPLYRRSIAALLGAALLHVLPATLVHADPQISRVSISTEGQAGDGPSYGPTLSEDGRFVAFVSYAQNLVPDDTNNQGYLVGETITQGADVFVYDRDAGSLERVSVSTGGEEAQGDSTTGMISADGRFVVFESNAPNLVSADTNLTWDVFVRDLELGTTERVSVADTGDEGNRASRFPAVSADGRYVVFQSQASTLVLNDENGGPDLTAWDVFLHDRETRETTRVSRSFDGGEALGDSTLPTISGDGTRIAFSSKAPNIVPEDADDGVDIFLADRASGVISRVATASEGGGAVAGFGPPSLSTNGCVVGFAAMFEPLELTSVFFDCLSSTVTPLLGSSRGPAISGNGTRIALASFATDPAPSASSVSGVYLYDGPSGAIQRVSVGRDGEAENGSSEMPAISSDGAVLAFASSSSNLVIGDNGALWDIFVYDENGCRGPHCDPANCQSGSDCDDGNPCTVDACFEGLCSHEPVEGKVALGCLLTAPWPPSVCAGVAVPQRIAKLYPRAIGRFAQAIADEVSVGRMRRCLKSGTSLLGKTLRVLGRYRRNVAGSSDCISEIEQHVQQLRAQAFALRQTLN